MIQKLKYALCALLLLLIGATAFADQPFVMTNPEQYIRAGAGAGSPLWGHAFSTLTTTSSSAIIRNRFTDTYTSPSTLHLFRWGTTVRMYCGAASVFCWTMSISASIDTGGTVTDRYATGAHTGAGPCFGVPANVYITQMVMKQDFKVGTLGRRDGFCSGNANTVDYPCRVNNDCGNAGESGVCNTSCISGGINICSGDKSPFNQVKGAYLIGVAGSSSSCWIIEEI